MSDAKLTAVTLTAEQLQALLLEVVRAAKEPDELTKQKIEEEKANRERRARQAVELAKLEEEQQQKRWAACSHTKPDGRRAIGGQVHSDGLIHPICLICNKQFTPVSPTPDQLVQGVQF
jgi:hypothetical protein